MLDPTTRAEVIERTLPVDSPGRILRLVAAHAASKVFIIVHRNSPSLIDTHALPDQAQRTCEECRSYPSHRKHSSRDRIALCHRLRESWRAPLDTRSAGRAMPTRHNRPPVPHRNGKRRWICSDRSTNSSAKRAAGIRRATHYYVCKSLRHRFTHSNVRRDQLPRTHRTIPCQDFDDFIVTANDEML